MSDAAYWRDYRRRIRGTEQAARYRATDNRRKARLRAIPGWRAQHEPGRRASRAVPPVPALHVGHPLFEDARAAFRSPSPGTRLAFSSEVDVDDARSEFVLAALEGRDPLDAGQSFLATQKVWRYLTLPIPRWAADLWAA